MSLADRIRCWAVVGAVALAAGLLLAAWGASTPDMGTPGSCALATCDSRIAP